MSERKLNVDLRISASENGIAVFHDTAEFVKHSVEFSVYESEPWTEVMRRLQSCVEAYYGYEFTGYGSRAEDSE